EKTGRPFASSCVAQLSSLASAWRFERCRGRAAEHDIPAPAQRPLRLGCLMVVARDQTLPRRRGRDSIEDRILEEQRVVGEIHLSHQPRYPAWAEQREVDVRRPPGVGMILPWIRARPDGQEAVHAVCVGQAAADAEEVWVERPRPAIALVDVAPGGVGLPDLDQRVWDGAALRVEHAPGYDNALADRLAARAGIASQVGVLRRHGADRRPRTG